MEADDNGEDEEIDSDEAFGEGDEERFKGFAFRGSSKPSSANGKPSKRPVAADFLSSPVRGESPGAEEEEDEMDGEEGSGSEDSQDSDSDGEGEDEDDMSGMEEADGPGADDATREELRKIFEQDRRRVMAPISQSAKAEAEKGMAVRSQRRSFDALLNIRVRLQKALVAVNSLGTVADEDEGVGKEAYQSAEKAALQLWNTIDSVRDAFLPRSAVKAGHKRKRDTAIDSSASSRAIWDAMAQVEDQAVQSRRKILDKWSSKVQRPTAAATRKLIATPSQSLVSNLDDQLLSADRLIKRTRTPRSCAPAQAAKKIDEDAGIYDDADFYQLLLKELVDQRATDASAPGSSVPTVRWAAIKEAKTRRHVDRKASKGRKLRFNVHEKLQNFTAPEDRTTWEPDAVDRFCGTLFGQTLELREDEGSDDGAEEAGLRLFRS